MPDVMRRGGSEGGCMSKRDGTFGDADIRPALRARLLARHPDETGSVVIAELGLCRGQVRIDLAVVNDLLHGYEIKSDRDSLRRLHAQVHLYSQVLDRATIVVGDRHLTETLDLVPSWWGVLRVRFGPRGPRFTPVRRGRKNPDRDPRCLVELLWLDAAIALLAEHDAARGIRGKPRRMVWDRICEHVEVDEIAAEVRAQLKARAAPQAAARPS